MNAYQRDGGITYENATQLGADLLEGGIYWTGVKYATAAIELPASVQGVLNKAKNGTLEKYLEKMLNKEYGGGQASSSRSYTNYNQPGGQSFGYGDYGINDVFGNSGYSTGNHMDLFGNWVSNTGEGSNTIFSGDGGKNGGSVAHY